MFIMIILVYSLNSMHNNIPRVILTGCCVSELLCSCMSLVIYALEMFIVVTMFTKLFMYILEM